jgi:hypothetical protein
MCSVESRKWKTAKKLLINKTNCFVLRTQSAKLRPEKKNSQTNHLTTKHRVFEGSFSIGRMPLMQLD